MATSCTFQTVSCRASRSLEFLLPCPPLINPLPAWRVPPQAMKDQFSSGRLYAKIASRPGQSGRCDGYILEGKELEFYMKKLAKKK